MGYVRPVLDYGMAAWSTTSKNNHMKIKRVQNQATRIITGGMKSTPILVLETITGLDDFETRHDRRILQQLHKYMCLSDHPMHEILNEQRKDRIQRNHFLSQARTQCQADPILSLSKITPLIPNCLYPPWKTFNPPLIINEIQGIMNTI